MLKTGTSQQPQGKAQAESKPEATQPHISGRGQSYLKVVDALAPLVHEQGRRLRVGRFDPRREQAALVGLVPDVLVQIRIRDL